MGARPSSFKSGGFLNNVDGVITGYEFSTKGPGGESDDWVFMRLDVRQDGADADVSTHLFMGGQDSMEISDDGKTVTADGVGANTGVGKFIISLVDAGFPETDLPEDEINYMPIVGARVRFTQQKNEKATAKYGKRKSKNGRGEYDRTDLVVSKFYGMVEVGKGKSASKTVTKAAGKPNGKAKEVDLTDDADAILHEILGAAKDGAMPKAKLPLALNKYFVANKHDHADELRRLVYSEDFLARENGWTFDQSSKNQVVSLEA